MKKSKANAIINLWNEEHAGSTAETGTKAVLCNGTHKGDYDVEIVPASSCNLGNSFHAVDSLALVEKAFRVSAYITTDKKGNIIAVLF